MSDRLLVSEAAVLGTKTTTATRQTYTRTIMDEPATRAAATKAKKCAGF